MGKLTEDLRELAMAQGMGLSHGYRFGDARVDTDRVTTIWPVPGRPDLSLTFEEEDGALWCADDMCPRQAVWAAMAGLGAAQDD